MENLNYAEYGTYILVILIAFLLIYIPRKMQEKKIKQIQKEIKLGDEIITYSGLFGKIILIEDNKIIIEVEPDNIKLTIDRWSIAGKTE